MDPMRTLSRIEKGNMPVKLPEKDTWANHRREVLNISDEEAKQYAQGAIYQSSPEKPEPPQQEPRPVRQRNRKPSGPRSLPYKEGMELFRHTILVIGYGETESAALVSAREQAHQVPNTHHFLGKIRPEPMPWGARHKYVFYATYVESQWWRENKSRIKAAGR